MALDDLIEEEYTSLEAVRAGFAGLEDHFRSNGDRRAVFATAYGMITGELDRRIGDGVFRDGDFVSRYAVAFANLYRTGLLAYERSPGASAPQCWRLAFAASQKGSVLVIHDLLLGINAHINHDLALALCEVAPDPADPERKADHDAVNDALETATDAIQRRIAELYSPGLAVLDLALGSLDERFFNFSFQRARQEAWASAVALAATKSEEQRTSIAAAIDARATALARLLLAPAEGHPRLFRVLRRLERLDPLWTEISSADPEVPPARLALRLGPLAEELALEVQTIEELTERLESTIERFDSERSRLSIYPSAYLLVTRRFERALAESTFEDGDWLLRLDLQFASQYFRALEAYEAGEGERVPRCWQLAFEAATGESTTLLQDLALAINARLNHDLALALYRTGVADDPELRRRDLVRIHDIFQASIDEIQAMLAAKYSRFLRFLDLIGGELDEMVVDFSYVRARDRAWQGAVELATLSSADERARAMEGLDHGAVRVAERLLARNVAAAGWVARALRHIEESFPGSWSEWFADSSETADASVGEGSA